MEGIASLQLFASFLSLELELMLLVSHVKQHFRRI